LGLGMADEVWKRMSWDLQLHGLLAS
jgi:hypothetical protein